MEFGHGSFGIAVRDQLAGQLGLSLLTGKTRPAPVMHCGPAEAGTAHGTDSVTVRFIRQLVELEIRQRP